MFSKKIDPHLIFGKNPVMEAIADPKITIEKIMVQNTLRGDLEKQVRRLSKEEEIPLSKLPPEKLDAITHRGNHQGVAAYISPIPYFEIGDVVAKAYAEGRTPRLLILEGVTDVRNVGAIARTALVFGMDGLVFPNKHSARISDDAIKISSGALLKIPVCRSRNMEEIVEACKNNGLRVFATDLSAETTVDRIDYRGPMAVIMGSEHLGIPPETAKMADALIKIPQMTDFDSLNVSVAAGIVLYELSKQPTGFPPSD